MTVGPIPYSLWLCAAPACPPRLACAVPPCDPIPPEISNPDYLPRLPYWQYLQVQNVREVEKRSLGRLIDVFG